MTRENFIEICEKWGYQKDRFGHYQKSFVDKHGEIKIYRLKISKILVRKEVKAKIGDKNEWIRLASGYLKDLKQLIDGSVIGFVSSLVR